MGISSFNKTIVTAFLAAACAMIPVAGVAADAPQESTTSASSFVRQPPKTEEYRSAMISLAEFKLVEARDPAKAGLEAWAALRKVQIYLEYAEYNLNTDEGYTKIGMTRDQFLELLDKNASIAIVEQIDRMRNPENTGLGAVSALDLVQQAAAELSSIRGQSASVILNSFGSSLQEVEQGVVDNARVSAQQIMEVVRSGEMSGADAWVVLVDMLYYMKRGKLDPQSDAGFRAIQSSLEEYQELKRRNALLAAANAWEQANMTKNAGRDALYFLDEVQTYLRRAGYDVRRGDGFSAVKTTQKAFRQLWAQNEVIQRNRGNGDMAMPNPA